MGSPSLPPESRVSALCRKRNIRFMEQLSVLENRLVYVLAEIKWDCLWGPVSGYSTEIGSKLNG